MPEAPITVTGFSTPESVLHDTQADVYLVSNINGNPLDADGNGFISRVSAEGEILDLKWIDGEAEGVTLNAPKGMALAGDRLFVTDITVLRSFDRSTGAPLAEYPIEGATFLNDVAVGPEGSVYFTDSGFQAGPEGFAPSGADALYRLTADGAIEKVAAGPELGGPNGVMVADDGVWVVTFGGKSVFRIVDGAVTDAVELPAGSLDGIEAADGEVLISSWEAQTIFRGPLGGPFTPAVTGVEAPADIGFDAGRGRLLIPLFYANEVRIVPLP